mmetsp:Transcript_805/g.1481  ORF Transcript_805/g.1481 Transcript_805/m.1481 type:complete len:288 (-) Transcript_805:1276-2139(-)
MTFGSNYWCLLIFILSTSCAILEAFPTRPQIFGRIRRKFATAIHMTSPQSPTRPIFSNDLCTVWKLSPNGQSVCKLNYGSSCFFVSSGVGDIDLKCRHVMNEDCSRFQSPARLSSKERVSWMPLFTNEGGESVDPLLEIDTSSVGPLNGALDVYAFEMKHVQDKREESLDGVSASEGVPQITFNVGTELLYNNSYINVWDFIIVPGETCHVHRHTKNYLFLNLDKSTTQGFDKNGELLGESSVQNAGQVTFVDLKGGETIHAARNLGESEFRQIIVELKEHHGPLRM